MEVAEDSGERYPPRTVYGIVCGVKRHLADKNGDEALNPLDGHDKRYGKLSTLFACLVLFISGIVLVFISSNMILLVG